MCNQVMYALHTKYIDYASVNDKEVMNIIELHGLHAPGNSVGISVGGV